MKKMLKRLLGLVMVAMVLVAASTTVWVSAYDNLVTNASFDFGWAPTGTGTGVTFSSDTTNYRTAPACLSINDNSSTLIPRESQTVNNIDPTKSYTFKYWVKNNKANQATVVRVSQLNSAGTSISSMNALIANTANVWKEITITYSTNASTFVTTNTEPGAGTNNIQFNSNTAKIQIELFATRATVAGDTCTTYYDDVSLVDDVNSSVNLVTNGSFGFPEWTPIATGTGVAFSTDITTASHSGVGCLKIDDQSTGLTPRATQTVSNIYPTKSYTFKYWVKNNKANQSTAVRISQLNSAGTSISTMNALIPNTADVWKEIKLTISPEATTFVTNTEPTAEASNIQFDSNTAKIQIELFATRALAGDTCTTYYDDVSLTQFDPYTMNTPTYDKDTGAVGVNITNNYLDSQAPTVIVAQYNVTDGKYILEGVQTQSSSLTVGSNAISKTFATSSNKPTSFVKVFLWDSINGIKPLLNAEQSQ